MSVTKQDDGRWVAKGTVCLPDGTRRHYNKIFKLKKDALAFETKRREELTHENPSMTFGVFFEQQQERDKLRIKESTVKMHQEVYNTRLKPVFEDVKLTAISVQMVEKWYVQLFDHLAIRTANITIGLLSSTLNAAVRMELIPSNPCSKILRIYKNPNQLEDKAENYWTTKEFDEFLNTNQDFKSKDIIWFLWATGVRFGECVGLQWRHYNGSTIRIEQAYSKKIHKITSPKTDNSVRTIILDRKTIQMLDQRKAEQSRIDGWDDDWYIFGSYQPLAYNTFHKQFQTALSKSDGIKRITIHGLRHSHASLLINAGVPDMVIADRLGHTVEMLHKTYAHLYHTSRENLKEKLDKLL